MYKKVRWRPEVASFRTKTLNFFLAMHLNWLTKFWMEGDRAPWSSTLMLLLITVVRVKLKKNCNGINNRLYGHPFYHWWHFNWEGYAPCLAYPLGYVYDLWRVNSFFVVVVVVFSLIETQKVMAKSQQIFFSIAWCKRSNRRMRKQTQCTVDTFFYFC